MKLQIHLTRSHYNKIVLVAADTGGHHSPGVSTVWTDPLWVETGWTTRFDGGRNTHTPSDFVCLYGEKSQFGIDDGNEPFLFALVVCDAWSQNASRAERYFLRHRRFSAGEVHYLTNDGLEEIRSAYERSDDWEVVAEADVPEHARQVMEKSIATVRALFGQGGDFFEV